MPTELVDEPAAARRWAWRQRLVDAETGLRLGIRTDSTLIVYFFCAACCLLTALVMGLTTLEWAVLAVSLGMALSAELFHQVLKQISIHLNPRLTLEFRQVLRLGTTAVVSAHLTALIVTGILFWERFATVWGK